MGWTKLTIAVSNCSVGFEKCAQQVEIVPQSRSFCVDVQLLVPALKKQNVQLETSQTAFFFFNTQIFLQLTWWLASQLWRAHHLHQKKNNKNASTPLQCVKNFYFIIIFSNKRIKHGKIQLHTCALQLSQVKLDGEFSTNLTIVFRGRQRAGTRTTVTWQVLGRWQNGFVHPALHYIEQLVANWQPFGGEQLLAGVSAGFEGENSYWQKANNNKKGWERQKKRTGDARKWPDKSCGAMDVHR